MKTVTNTSKDPRKFYDKKSGRDVILQPGESTFTSSPPEEKLGIFKVEDSSDRNKPRVKCAGVIDKVGARSVNKPIKQEDD